MNKEYYVCMEYSSGEKYLSGPYVSFEQAEGFRLTLSAAKYKNTFVVVTIEEQNRG